MSMIKGVNWSPFPGYSLPVFQDNLARVNARQTYFYPQEMLYTTTRLETRGMATRSCEKRHESFSRDDVC